jgi:hypothetical protein
MERRMSLKAKLYKFLIEMGRITIEDVPEPYKRGVVFMPGCLLRRLGSSMEVTG